MHKCVGITSKIKRLEEESRGQQKDTAHYLSNCGKCVEICSKTKRTQKNITEKKQKKKSETVVTMLSAKRLRCLPPDAFHSLTF